MRIIILIVFLVLFLARLPAYAIDPAVQTTMQSAQASTGNGTAASTAGYASIGVQVVMSATATVNFEANVDGSNWVAVTCVLSSDLSTASSATASGLYQCNVSGYNQLRARVSANTGTVDVKALATTTALKNGSSGTTGWPTAITIAATTSEAAPLKVRGTGGQATSGWNIYQHSNGTPTIKCVIADVEGDCNVVVALNASKLYQIKDSSGNILFEVDSATGAMTTQVIWDLDLVAVSGGVASHVWNTDPLSTACAPLVVSGTNRTTGYCTFTDVDGDQGVQISRVIPSRTLGILDADVWWKTTGTGNARFQFQTKCYADDEADDAAFNTASVVTAAAGTSARPNKQTISAITTTGCAAGELMRIRFYRNRTEGSDTLTAALDVEKVVFRLR